MKPIPINVVAKALDLHHKNQALVHKVAIDSRKVEPGDLFFALPGSRVDGHNFLQEAARKGAVGAVVHDSYRGEAFGLPLLHVPDVLITLQELARQHLKKRDTKIVAITGSLGKTTTKSFVTTLLRSQYKVFASPLSYNSQASLPVSILMTDETEEILILEMGMTHTGQIEKLVSIAPPDVALLTNVAMQHTCNFPDGIDGVKREKTSIFLHEKTKLGIYPYDLGQVQGSCRKMTFSLVDRRADHFLEIVSGGVRIHSENEPPIEMPLQLPLKPFYHNFLAAVALARAFDIPWPLIQESSAHLRLPPMRFERIDVQGIVFINDAYNANPDSMKAALEQLPKGEKTIAVLGEMDALGIYSEAGHALVAKTALHHVDILLCLGKRCETMCEVWREEKRHAELFESREALEKRLKELAKPGDVVLLKGARIHALDQVLERF